MKKFLALIAALVVGGCANFYTLEGVKYNSKEEFHQAVMLKNTDALNSIQPLSAPVTKKNLILAFPSEATIYAENIARTTKLNGQAPSGLLLDRIDNVTKANFRLSKVFADGVQKKAVYASLKFIEVPSMTVSIEPSTDTDVLYFSEPAIGTGQWFFATQKSGKQVFGYDRSGGRSYSENSSLCGCGHDAGYSRVTICRLSANISETPDLLRGIGLSFGTNNLAQNLVRRSVKACKWVVLY